MCEPESCVLLLWKGTCSVPILVEGTMFTGGSCMNPMLYGSFELGLSAEPAAGVADSPVVS